MCACQLQTAEKKGPVRDRTFVFVFVVRDGATTVTMPGNKTYFYADTPMYNGNA